MVKVVISMHSLALGSVSSPINCRRRTWPTAKSGQISHYSKRTDLSYSLHLYFVPLGEDSLGKPVGKPLKPSGRGTLTGRHVHLRDTHVVRSYPYFKSVDSNLS